MADAAKLRELADKVEKLTEGDRTVDGLIYIATQIPADRAGRIDQDRGVVGWWPKDAPYVSAIDVPRYTASLDAAMTLVPEGCLWTMDSFSAHGWSAGIWKSSNASWLVRAGRPRQRKKPALALTAAALRARAALAVTAEESK